MFDKLQSLYQIDWHIFMAAAEQWRQGGNPYGHLSMGAEALPPFPYPPTSLTWLSLFTLTGAAGFYIWTALELGLWWLLIRNRCRSQLILLCWSPLLAHFVLGQNTFAMVLALWAVYLAPKRGWWCGLALAWALTKPQAALLPLCWILWEDRKSPLRLQLWGGLLLGTALLALPPTLRDPGVWNAWLGSLDAHRASIQITPPWTGWGIPILLAAGWLWRKQLLEKSGIPVWPWWLTAALFPQSGLYPAVILMPVMQPRQSYWTIGGLALSSMLIGPANGIMLPIILAGHILAAWFINGGPQGDKAAMEGSDETPPLPQAA